MKQFYLAIAILKVSASSTAQVGEDVENYESDILASPDFIYAGDGFFTWVGILALQISQVGESPLDIRPLFQFFSILFSFGLERSKARIVT